MTSSALPASTVVGRMGNMDNDTSPPAVEISRPLTAETLLDRVSAIHGPDMWDFAAAFEAFCIAFEMGEEWDQDSSGDWIMSQALVHFAEKLRKATSALTVLEDQINRGQANWLRNAPSPFANEPGRPHPAEVWRRDMSRTVTNAMKVVGPKCRTCGEGWGECDQREHFRQEFGYDPETYPVRAEGGRTS